MNKEILSCFPNPINNEASFEYCVLSQGLVKMDIWNIFGEKVLSLVNNTQQVPGKYKIGSKSLDLSSGVYFVTYQNNDLLKTIQVIILNNRGLNFCPISPGREVYCL